MNKFLYPTVQLILLFFLCVTFSAEAFPGNHLGVEGKKGYEPGDVAMQTEYNRNRIDEGFVSPSITSQNVEGGSTPHVSEETEETEETDQSANNTHSPFLFYSHPIEALSQNVSDSNRNGKKFLDKIRMVLRAQEQVAKLYPERVDFFISDQASETGLIQPNSYRPFQVSKKEQFFYDMQERTAKIKKFLLSRRSMLEASSQERDNVNNAIGKLDPILAIGKEYFNSDLCDPLKELLESKGDISNQEVEEALTEAIEEKNENTDFSKENYQKEQKYLFLKYFSQSVQFRIAETIQGRCIQLYRTPKLSESLNKISSDITSVNEFFKTHLNFEQTSAGSLNENEEIFGKSLNLLNKLNDYASSDDLEMIVKISKTKLEDNIDLNKLYPNLELLLDHNGDHKLLYPDYHRYRSDLSLPLPFITEERINRELFGLSPEIQEKQKQLFLQSYGSYVNILLSDAMPRIDALQKEVDKFKSLPLYKNQAISNPTSLSFPDQIKEISKFINDEFNQENKSLVSNPKRFKEALILLHYFFSKYKLPMLPETITKLNCENQFDVFSYQDPSIVTNLQDDAISALEQYKSVNGPKVDVNKGL